MSKVVFLDRDGVINNDYGYVNKWSDFDIFPETVCALKILRKCSYQIAIVTNQSGIARGYFSFEEYIELTKRYVEYFLNHGIEFLEIAVCPHHPRGVVSEFSYVCECRKPRTKLITDILNVYNVSAENCVMVGDKMSDIEAGRNAGIKKLYKVTKIKNDKILLKENDYLLCNNLLTVAKHLNNTLP